MITIARAQLVLFAVLIAVASGAIGFLVGAPWVDPGARAAATSTPDASQPDWTVAPCALWTDTSNPELPPYTLPSVCFYTDAHGSIQLSRP